MPISILLVDDHQIVLDCVQSLIAQEKGMEIIGCAISGKAGLRIARLLKPGIIITDVRIPDMTGMDFTRRALESSKNSKVIALSMLSDSSSVTGMIEAGVSGYILKENSFKELASAIRLVAAGHTFFCPQITGALVKKYICKAKGNNSGLHPLSAREFQIFKLLAEGMKVKDISSTLAVSMKTIETHRRNIMLKLDFNSSAELIKYAIREKIVSLNL